LNSILLRCVPSTIESGSKFHAHHLTCSTAATTVAITRDQVYMDGLHLLPAASIGQ
jgi:hypothetical protein